jgi:hypothetical protein
LDKVGSSDEGDNMWSKECEVQDNDSAHSDDEGEEITKTFHLIFTSVICYLVNKTISQSTWNFSKNIIGANRRYGLAYYLSSFHTLAVLILLSVFYPTLE